MTASSHTAKHDSMQDNEGCVPGGRRTRSGHARPLPRTLTLTVLGIALTVTGQVQAQSFVDNSAAIPSSGSPQNDTFAENVDFADIDLDGDLDATFANGGDLGNVQNSIWVNQGPSSLGLFLDETTTRLPAISDASRDIEFVDFDGDGDPDIYVSNSSQFMNQTNRWWHNTGLGSGAFTDETQARWLDLGQNDGVTTFSSVSNAVVLASGGFIDWSCDCDFGDLDNDGDLDLLHSAYGGSFSGQVPTRLFLNDGDGFFTEFNPSGVQLNGSFIPNGTPALWAEGVHQHDTTAADGSEADIATTPLDIDVADIDGDLDLDILLGARNETPRLFVNNQDSSKTLPPFRDATYALLSDHAAIANYEQEFGDVDNDGDVDLFGLNWAGMNDTIMLNDGTGFFEPWTIIPGSAPAGSCDSEGDFIDYDNDGDNDLIISVFRGQDRLYENDGTGTYTQVTATEMPIPASVDETALDIDAADIDNDGDYDMFAAQQFGPGVSGNLFYLNVTQTPDTHAPRVLRLEQAGNRMPSMEPTVVRVQVYDNTPYYITYTNRTWLEVTVDGGRPTTVPMTSSGGQIFRGEIPGTLVGLVCYTAHSEDAYGNRGSSTTNCFVSNGSVVVYCTAKTSSAGCVATIGTSDSANQPISGVGGYSVTARRVQGEKTGLLFASISGPSAIPFGGGTLCMNPPLKRGPVQFSGGSSPVECNGRYTTLVNDGTSFPIGMDPGAGMSATYQYWYRDPSNGAGNFGTALSDAVLLTFQ